MLNLHLLVKVGVWVTPAFERKYIEFYSLNSVLPLHSVLPGSIIAPSIPTIMSSSILIQLVFQSFNSSIELFIIMVQQTLHLCSYHVQ